MVTIRLKDKNNGCLSKDVSIEEIILNQYEIEFEFPNYIDEYGDVMDVATLPYKDFLFFQNDYEVIIDEHIKQQDYFKDRDLVYVNGGRGYGKTQYEKLQHNWDKLKSWLEENESFDDYCNETTFTSVLDKMQEIEEKNNA